MSFNNKPYSLIIAWLSNGGAENFSDWLIRTEI